MESIINKKIKNATVITFNNIKFKSKLECLMYKLLIESNLEVQHEETKIILMEGFYPKKWFSKSKEQVKKILNLTYTPDFIVKHNNYRRVKKWISRIWKRIFKYSSGLLYRSICSLRTHSTTLFWLSSSSSVNDN